MVGKRNDQDQAVPGVLGRMTTMGLGGIMGFLMWSGVRRWRAGRRGGRGSKLRV
jgi:hypothetical protein